MKLASFRTAQGDTFGVVSGQGLISLTNRLAGGQRTLRDALASGALGEIRAIAAREKPDVKLSTVEFLPVIPDPSKILAIGINYRSHAAETGRSVEPRPSIFARLTNTLIGHQAPLVRPRVSQQFDFEGELAVIIGRTGRHIPASTALDHVAGYTCFVDGSVRDYQKQSVTAGKNFPATGPLGPWMVTADEVLDPSRLVLTTRLNGQEVQKSGLDMLIHPIPSVIEYLSEITVLEPGDVIATGTPAGVGHRRSPPLWMKAGDVLEVEISGIGTLRNPVIDEAAD